jgi:hypothetical protein
MKIKKITTLILLLTVSLFANENKGKNMRNEFLLKDNMNIKIIAGFVSLKFLPKPMSIGHNNLNPKLILKKDSIEYKGAFFTNNSSYDNIESIDIYINDSLKVGRIGTINLYILFKNTQFIFIANINNKAKLREVIEIFNDIGVSISKDAKVFMNTKE